MSSQQWRNAVDANCSGRKNRRLSCTIPLAFGFGVPSRLFVSLSRAERVAPERRRVLDQWSDGRPDRDQENKSRVALTRSCPALPPGCPVNQRVLPRAGERVGGRVPAWPPGATPPPPAAATTTQPVPDRPSPPPQPASWRTRRGLGADGATPAGPWRRPGVHTPPHHPLRAGLAACSEGPRAADQAPPQGEGAAAAARPWACPSPAGPRGWWAFPPPSPPTFVGRAAPRAHPPVRRSACVPLTPPALHLALRLD